MGTLPLLADNTDCLILAGVMTLLLCGNVLLLLLIKFIDNVSDFFVYRSTNA